MSESKNKFVSLVNVNKYYDNGMHAVVDFNLDIKPQEFIVFVGPSGCGKSTTLRMIAGLEDISGGELYINGMLANDLEPVDRDVAMVFQSYALYPNMTIYDNMAFTLQVRKKKIPLLDENGNPVYEVDKSKIKLLNREISLLSSHNKDGENDEKIAQIEAEIANLSENPSLPSYKYERYSKEEIDERVHRAAKLLEIEDQLQKKPKALSGGQRQRVALGRAIVKDSNILLMDEPLSNLDAKLRVHMRSEIVKLHEQMKATTIYVTHDQTEAMTMASRIVVMSRGVVQQIGTPEEIYKHPANLFVASFIGSPAMNFIDASLKGKELLFKDGHKLALEANKVQAVKAFYQALHDEWTSDLPSFIEARSAQLEREYKAKKFKRGKKFEYVEDEDPEVIKRKENLSKIEELLKGEEYQLTFGIRPESVKESEKGEEFEVEFVELLGDEYYVHFTFGEKKCLAKVPAERKIVKGEKIKLEFAKEKIHLFDPISSRAIF